MKLPKTKTTNKFITFVTVNFLKLRGTVKRFFAT